jgi:hypothetical protein
LNAHHAIAPLPDLSHNRLTASSSEGSSSVGSRISEASASSVRLSVTIVSDFVMGVHHPTRKPGNKRLNKSKRSFRPIVVICGTVMDLATVLTDLPRRRTELLDQLHLGFRLGRELGNELNGFVAEGNVKTPEEIAEFLQNAAIKHFPTSDYAERPQQLRALADVVVTP